jgi:hypothetical protein
MPTKRKEGIPSTPKRKQAFDQKFISPRQLAIRWDLSLSAVYHGPCRRQFIKTNLIWQIHSILVKRSRSGRSTKNRFGKLALLCLSVPDLVRIDRGVPKLISQFRSKQELSLNP